MSLSPLESEKRWRLKISTNLAKLLIKKRERKWGFLFLFFLSFTSSHFSFSPQKFISFFTEQEPQKQQKATEEEEDEEKEEKEEDE